MSNCHFLQPLSTASSFTEGSQHEPCQAMPKSQAGCVLLCVSLSALGVHKGWVWGVQINSLHLCSFVASLELATKGHFADVHSSSKYYKKPKTYRSFTWFGFVFNKHYDFLMLRIKLTSKYQIAHRSKFCGTLSLGILFPTLYILDVKAYMRSEENAYQPFHRNWSSVSLSSHIPSTFPVNRRREATLDIKFTRECWPWLVVWPQLLCNVSERNHTTYKCVVCSLFVRV